LFTAALGTNAVVKSQAEALFFSQIADRAVNQSTSVGGVESRQTLLLWHLRASSVVKTRMDVAFSSAPVEKTA